MKISELAQRTGVSKETIHYYIREGVLRKPRKSTKNSADYSEDYAELIPIIKALQEDYFLPLSIIKKIIKQLKKQSLSEKASFQFLSKYFRPIERLFAPEIIGREAFLKTTGLVRRFLDKFEQWGIITPELKEGQLVYSKDDVIIGKLIVHFDRLGFNEENGIDAEDLRFIADFVREYVTKYQAFLFKSSLNTLSSDELARKGGAYMETISLFLYHIYHKLFAEEYARLLKSVEERKD